MEHSIRVGLSFGITSGIITTLGLMVGLNSSTNSKLVVIGGVLIIAIADAFSDAFGIHISEESENRHTPRQIWKASISTLLAKFIFASTFIIPILLFELQAAIKVAVIWGLLLLGIFSFFIAKREKANPWRVIAEHIIIALVVVAITNYVGGWISSVFA